MLDLIYNIAAYEYEVLLHPSLQYVSRANSNVPRTASLVVSRLDFTMFDSIFYRDNDFEKSAIDWCRQVFIDGAKMVFESEEIEVRVHVDQFAAAEALKVHLQATLSMLAKNYVARVPGAIKIKCVVVVPSGTTLNLDDLLTPRQDILDAIADVEPNARFNLKLWMGPGGNEGVHSISHKGKTFFSARSRLEVTVETE